MNKEALSVSTTSTDAAPSELTEARPHIPASSTTSRSKASTARRTGEDFTSFQALQLLRIEDVCRMLRISKPTFWRLRRRADFPEPTAVTERVMAWNGSDIQRWLQQRKMTAQR